MDSTALMVMLEEIERDPNAFAHGALLGACFSARAEIARLRAELARLREAVMLEAKARWEKCSD